LKQQISSVLHNHHVRLAMQTGVALFVCLLVGWATQQILLSKYLKSLDKTSWQHMEFYRLSLDSLLARNESLPRLVAQEEKLAKLLLHPNDSSVKKSANLYLREVQGISDIDAAYLMDANGLTLAASNFEQPLTFVGNNYACRPYFREAMQGKLGQFFGIGMTTGLPGYFLAAPVTVAGKRLGVSVIKVSLAGFEKALLKSGDLILLTDSFGVIFLTSVEQWKYRTLTQLDEHAAEQLHATQKYSNTSLEPLDTPLMLKQGLSVSKISLPKQGAGDYLVHSSKVGNLGWNMVLLANTEQARRDALMSGVVAGLATAILFSFVSYFNLNARQFRERRQAETALRQAHLELEQRIEERTIELVATNVSLEEKVTALKTTEDILRETRDNAVQAGKLAVLGQMAAGITHELNQPLTALHTFADNAVSLLDRGNLQDVRENLGRIRHMSDRMGKIVNEIKTFAHKTPTEHQKVRIADAINQAVMLVEQKRRQVQARIIIEPFPEDIQVSADSIRFEQVLVNLLRNGLDAVLDRPEKEITITVVRRAPDVYIHVRDTGPGIAESIVTHLFEPFFTTKAAGQGLGLGLAISRMIIADCGGRLDVGNGSNGGAECTIVLEEA
jgi:two-component system C4-dicarboxylate transport sensor histidine kinase DctB